MSTIALRGAKQENQLMLDSKELAKRLRAAMDNHRPPILSVELAERCGVSRQAVNGWRKNGRYHKKHLQTIAEMTGQPLEFFVEDERASSKTTRVAWQRIGAALMVMLVVLVTPYSIGDARAAFSSKVAAHVYFVKSALRRLLTKFQQLRTYRVARA
jgi:transcriptional regulator with XRE-family HTH domain